MTSDCIFCKIVAGEIPSYKVYEDENFFAFLDIKPLNPGHVLVVPKKHYRWVWDISEDYSKPVNKVANVLKKAFETEYVQSLVMGEIPHAHIHLIPRWEGDDQDEFVDIKKTKDLPEEEMKEIAEKIKNSF